MSRCQVNKVCFFCQKVIENKAYWTLFSSVGIGLQQICKVMGCEPNIAFFSFINIHDLTQNLYSTVHAPSSKTSDFGHLIGGGRAGSRCQISLRKLCKLSGPLELIWQEVALTWWGWCDLWLAEAIHRLHTRDIGLANQKRCFTRLFPSWKQVLVTQTDNAWTWCCSYQMFDLTPPPYIICPLLFFGIFTKRPLGSFQDGEL